MDWKGFCNSCGHEGPSGHPKLSFGSISCPRCSGKNLTFYDEEAYQRIKSVFAYEFIKFLKADDLPH